MSKLTTCVTPLMSSPRAATSVANIRGHSLSVNFFSASSRSFCCLSPCTAHVPNPWFQKVFDNISTRRLVFANATTRLPSGKFTNNSYMCLSFSSSWALMNFCVTDLFALSSPASAPSPPPRKTRTAACLFFVSAWPSSPLVPSAKKVDASFRTALGQVAVKRVVCRPAPTACVSVGTFGTSRNTSFSCGSNPMSNMRSASSRVIMKQFCRLKLFCCIKSHSLPGVAMTISPSAFESFKCAFSCVFCSYAGAPPYRQTEFKPKVLPNFTASRLI
mmetsp:Transcript_5328/g.19998  ORF Transcript_5328/g.19998 Transcript_5328/m.19998 type:complete len:274 (-) Transcript_5328:516-1337(-)